MSTQPYGLLCPISKACEVLQSRWTLPILCEMWAGETRFNDIARSVGGISPTTLSRRLAEMEAAGLVERIEDPASGTIDYVRTPKAIELEPALLALAGWAQRNIEAELALSYDLSTLMWKMRKLDTTHLPARRVVIRLHISDADGPHDTYWLLHTPGRPLEICVDIPGFDVDLFVETTQASFGAVIMGRSSLEREIDLGRFFVSGDAMLERTMKAWFPRSRFAEQQDIAPLPAPQMAPAPRA